MKEFQKLAAISTALVFDASIRLGIPVRVAPVTLRPFLGQTSIVGGVLPARHYGSVDVFLEAINNSEKGDVLVIDNGGRNDEACIGDLITLEAKASGLQGIVVWGCHRDTEQLRQIDLPVFSLGPCARAPAKIRSRAKDALCMAHIGNFRVDRKNVVVGDDDGVLFVSKSDLKRILKTAKGIATTERRQAAQITKGKTLRTQLQFEKYIEKRNRDSSYTFRKHLRTVGGAIEE